jgi:serine/threonine-protein kinase
MSPEGLNRAIGNSDQVGKRSDVFQLCSVFWFVVTGRNPAGVVSKNDWNGPDNIFSVIYDSLSHDERQRPSSGGELVERLNLATLPTG